MNILILSRTERYYATHRLVEEARKGGHKVIVADPLKYTLVTNNLTPFMGNLKLSEEIATVASGDLAMTSLRGVIKTTKQSQLSMLKAQRFNVIMPRIGNIAIEYSLAMVKQFELLGVRSINTSDAIYLAKDKFVSLMVLQNKGLPVPETFMVRNKQALKRAGKKLGG
jgi:ribosomal protein S6--L-glutamate ligase